jgi:tetratricopeptide (TPR) repeat protein
MIRRLPVLFIAASFLLNLAQQSFAQSADPGRIFMKDGRVLTPVRMQRSGDDILATFPRQQKAADGTVTNIPGSEMQVGIKLGEIAKLDFAKPTIIDAAPKALAEGKAEALLKALQPEVDRFAGFRDAPGSWWVDLVPMQIQALLSLKRDKEAQEAADTFARQAADPENQRLTKAFAGVARTRKGEHKAALALYAEAMQTVRRHDIMGMIAVNRGDSLLAIADALKAENKTAEAVVEYEQALLSYTRVAALYPSQRGYLPQATLGAAKAHFGLDDFERAKAAIKELKTDFASTPEAAQTDELLTKVEKREKLLSPAGASATETKKQ